MTQEEEGQKSKGFVQLSSSTLMQELEGETVLLDLDDEVYFSLDEVGSDMLRVVQNAHDIEDAVVQLCEIYEIDAETLTGDLERFLGELNAAGLIRRK